MSRIPEVSGRFSLEDHAFECNPTVQNVQRGLNLAAGREVVSEDGMFDAKTEQALRDFQRAQGLSATGTIDSQTLAKLNEKAEENSSLPTNSNAERTLARKMAPYADAGMTSSGDSRYVGVALLKGTEDVGSNSTLSADLMYASAQVGKQQEFAVGMVRIGTSVGLGDRARLNVGAEAFTWRAHDGVHNDDGSVGKNFGAGATIVGAEATLDFGNGNSVTAGASYGTYTGGSVGVRDADKDGKGEGCIRVATPVVTLGACVETPW